MAASVPVRLCIDANATYEAYVTHEMKQMREIEAGLEVINNGLYAKSCKGWGGRGQKGKGREDTRGLEPTSQERRNAATSPLRTGNMGPQPGKRHGTCDKAVPDRSVGS